MTSGQQVFPTWKAEPGESAALKWQRCRERAEEVKVSHGVFTSILAKDHLEGANPEGEISELPFAVKDNIDVAGAETTAGSPLLRGNMASRDAGVVSALREAGAVPLAKANMHELAFGVTSNNAHFGAVRNPVDPGRSAGGSSGGSAAAVALGVVPFSLGTDTGASVTLPSSFCGVVGFRPSTGRYPGDGIVNISWSRDTVGLHTRTVAEAQFLDRIITATAQVPSTKLDGLKLGLPRGRFDDLSPEVEHVTSRALRLLEEVGIALVEVEVEDDERLAAQGGMTVVLFETSQLLTSYMSQRRSTAQDIGQLAKEAASPDVAGILRHIADDGPDEGQYEEARGLLWQLRRSYESTFRAYGVDALIAPTAVALPPRLGADVTFEHNGRSVPTFDTLTRNTAAGTSAGLPMISIPAGIASDGLPIGILLEAPRFEDAKLLSIAAEIETVLSAA